MPLLCSSLLLFTACTIQPPLHLPDDPQDVTIDMPIVITDLDVIWQVDADWRSHWYYGWDEEDERMWGKLEYPQPTNFEVRRFYTGYVPAGPYQARDGFTVYGRRFRRNYQIGYYDLLVWSNIDAPDGVQAVVIDESNTEAIMATTSPTRVGYKLTRAAQVRYQPEMFYDAYQQGYYISPDTADYDYFDTDENVWVKLLHVDLVPVVYMYLVQVVVHNNDGRITGLSDVATMGSVAEGVNLQTMHTTVQETNVTFDMRMKKGIDVEGETCDVLGGKLTTYGLCDMPNWSRTRAPQYTGTRADLPNELTVDYVFVNGMTKTYVYDVTRQMQTQAHGGVITIHIDANEIPVPDDPDRPSSSGFLPTVEEPADSVVHEFGV